MNREEALEYFKNKTVVLTEEEALANAMAIKALEQEPTTKNDLGVDCISRDSAITALDYDIKCFEFKSGVSKHMDDIAKLLNTIYETQVNNMKALPSATPLSSGLDKNSKKLEKGTTKNDLGVDLISRNEVLNRLASIAKIKAKSDAQKSLMGRCMFMVERMPSVTPQLSVPEVTAHAEWTEKLTKASEDAYNKGYADGMKEQEPQKFKWCTDCREYDQEKHCCHRWSKAIRNTVEEMKQEYIEREVLDKIKAEIETKYGQCDICEYFEDYDYEENDISEYRPIGNIADILQILDKYKAESEET